MWRLGAWVSGAALICAGVGACGRDPRGVPDAGDAAEPPDAMPPGCGDGIVQPEVLPPLVHPENCDEGPMNGTAETLCALDCRVKQAELTIDWTLTLPLPAKKLIISNTGLGTFASSFDDRGIAVLGAIGPGPGWKFIKASGVPTDFTLHTMNEPLGGGSGMLDLVWIERGLTLGDPPRLYWMELDPNAAPVVQELAFPVPNVTQAKFAHLDANQAASWLVLSVVADGRLYLIQAASPLGAGGWMAASDLGVAPSTELGRAVQVEGAHVEQPRPEWVHFARLVQLFGTGPTVVRTATFEMAPPPTAVTSFETTWPSSVISADDGYYVPNEADANQLAVMALDGTVDVWDFDHEPDEIEPTYYGQMPSATQQISTARQWPAMAVIGVVSDGSIAVLANNGAGRALATQRFQIGPPCDVCAFALQPGWDYQPYWVVLDNVAYHFSLRIAGD